LGSSPGLRWLAVIQWSAADMVSQATVNAKMAYGFSKAAAALGAPCQLYRPHSIHNPLDPSAWVSTVQAAFRIPNTDYTAPSAYAKPLWWGLFDTSLVQAGDYLLDPTLGCFFVASTEVIHYPLVISCNTSLTISRPAPEAPGADHYEGATLASETVLATAWPASLLNGTKGEASDLRLPGDVRNPWAAILLPPSFPAQIVTGDVAMTVDTSQRRYTLSAAELTGSGWRITGALAGP
jgi:hypothetical protein